MLLTAALMLMTSAPAQDVSVRSDHAQVIVGAERYRLVGARQPLTAVVRGGPNSEVVVEVIRLGTPREPVEGAVPLSVKVQKERNVFPNRPKLEKSRTATWAGQKGVASFPVRYPLDIVANKRTVVRVALLRPDRGGSVGVRLIVQSKVKATLAELDKNAGGSFSFPALDARPKKKRGRSSKATRRRSKRPVKVAVVETPSGSSGDEVAGDDSAPADASSENATNGDGEEASDEGSEAGSAASEDEGATAGDDNAVEQDGGVATGGESDEALAAAEDGAEEEDSDAGPTAVAVVEKAPPPAPALQGKLKIVLRNEMGDIFQLQKRTVTVDGVLVHSEEGALPYPRTIAFERSVQAGSHDVEVRLSYLGDGGFFFQYVNAYTFHVNDRRRIGVPASGSLTVVVSGTEAGGPFAELTEKPAVVWTFER